MKLKTLCLAFALLQSLILSLAFSQGWQQVTPSRLQKIDGFHVFDKQNNEFEVFCWDNRAYQFGYHLSPLAIQDSFVSSWMAGCGEPVPVYYATIRVQSVIRPFTGTNVMWILYDNSGCPGGEGWAPGVSICQDTIVKPGMCLSWLGFFYGPPCSGRSSFLYSTVSEPNVVYLIASDSILKTSNGGATFRGLRRPRPLSDRCCIDQFFVVAPGVYLAGGPNPNGQSYALYRTSDSSQTWTPVFDMRARAIVSDPLAHNVVFLASDSGLYRSTTSGVSWSRMQTGSFRSIKFGRDGRDDVFAGTETGELWRSTNRGNLWSIFNNTFSDSSVVGLYVYPAGDTVLACATNGLYKVFDSYVVGVNENATLLPLRFALNQNYPNPFNPTTEIRYQIPVEDPTRREVGRVMLKVFDLLGREVATLVDEVQGAGFRSVEFNASGLASGVYFYSLRAGSYIQTKKMLLIR